MKNEATTPQASDAWRAAMRQFDRELQRRGAAERTRRAYGVDLGQLALWSSANAIEPHEVDQPALRRYAAQLASRGAGARAVAGKLAAIRSFFRSMVELGELTSNPAEPPPAPRQRRLPGALEVEEVAALLNRIPATTPLELRDGAMFELAYACGLRAEELVNLDLESIELDAEQVRVQGKGGKTRFVPAGEPALRSVARYLERGRPGLAGADAGAEPALLLSKSGRRLSSSDVRRRLRVWARHAEGGANLWAIRDLFGHASISMTPDYTRVESSRLRDAYARSHPRA
jgi:site-specific recombinase XerD